MLATFFALAVRSPSRRQAFRRVVVGHLLVVSCTFMALRALAGAAPIEIFGHLLLVAGIVEGALLLGWRLTQLPKSQALEFLLVTPLRPGQFFFGEALVGLVQCAFVTLSGLPILVLAVLEGLLRFADLLPLLIIPLTWGAVTGFGLSMWAYESACLRRLGEKVAVALVLVYLLVGILAGENLRAWLGVHPDEWASLLLHAFARFHTDNPFGVMRYWLSSDSALATEAVIRVTVIGAGLVALLALRAAWRMQAHFHELHYQPIAAPRDEQRPAVGEQPLTWWAVKRVARFSGRVNLWLGGGFGLMYAAYVVAGDAWPAWLGRLVFEMCDQAGGVAALTTGLVLLAAVPAAFQYGLWDASAHARCRRLELLLLTELEPKDYWHAAVTAAWNRGRGYLAIAAVLWLAGLCAGRLSVAQTLAAAAGGVLLWCLYFTLGFRAFSRGVHANRLGMLLTVGLPLLLLGAVNLGWPTVSAALPPGVVYASAAAPVGLDVALGAVLAGGLSLMVARWSIRDGDAELRRWYDRHSGAKAMR